MLRKLVVVASFAGLVASLLLWAVNGLWGTCAFQGSSWGVEVAHGHLRLLQAVQLESIPARTIQAVELSVALPLLALLCGAVLFTVRLLIPRFREHRCKKRGVCASCGYDLRGSTDRCPECGRPFCR